MKRIAQTRGTHRVTCGGWTLARTTGLAVVIHFALFGLGCGPPPEAPSAAPEAQKPVRVRWAKATAGELAEEVEWVGEVVRRRAVNVGPLAAGTLASVQVVRGQEVIAGQVLGALDDEVERRAVHEANAAVALAKAQMSEAKSRRGAAERELQRRRPLADKQAFPQAELARLADEVEVAKAAVASAEARLEQTRATSRTAEVMLARRTIMAPISGTVISEPAAPGTSLSPGGPPLLTLQDNTSLRFVVQIPDNQWPLVAPLISGIPIEPPLDSMEGRAEGGGEGSESLQRSSGFRIRLDAWGQDAVEAPARVDRVSEVVDPASRTVDIDLVVETSPSERPLLAGMFGRARLAVRSAKGTIVPTKAIVRGANGASMWRLREGIAAQTPVVVLLEVNQKAVVEGIAPGQIVATSGLKALKDGEALELAAEESF